MTGKLRNRIAQWQGALGALSYESGDPEWVAVSLPELRVSDCIFNSEEDAQRYIRNGAKPYNMAVRVRVSRESAELKRLYHAAEKARVRYLAVRAECAPWNRASKTFACKTCGTRLVCSELEASNSFSCPICGAYLLSDTRHAKQYAAEEAWLKANERFTAARASQTSHTTMWYVECAYWVD